MNDAECAELNEKNNISLIYYFLHILHMHILNWKSPKFCLRIGEDSKILDKTYFATHREFFLQILLNETEIRLYLSFLIDLELNGHPFGSKSIGKW